MTNDEIRSGEVSLPFDPAVTADDAALIFIGRIRSPWKTRAECPKNMTLARERGQTASIELDAAWRAGLDSLEKFSHIIVLYWMHDARRDIIVQTPRHNLDSTGVFALRSPVRPNPIAIATVRILDLNKEIGRITIDAIDCIDETPLLDIKPWFEAIDGIATQSAS